MYNLVVYVHMYVSTVNKLKDIATERKQMTMTLIKKPLKLKLLMWKNNHNFIRVILRETLNNT